MSPTDIYLKMMKEALERLSACERYMNSYILYASIFDLESAALQMRKAMEAIAFASIAPIETMYSQFRKNAAKPGHHGDDWSASKIFLNLEKVNSYFYPRPMIGPIEESAGNWAFQEFVGDYMNRRQFEKMYNRLGKFLHADNPWGSNKGWGHFAKELPPAVNSLRALLHLHVALIQLSNSSGAWIVHARADGTPPYIFQARADGAFIAT